MRRLINYRVFNGNKMKEKSIYEWIEKCRNQREFKEKTILNFSEYEGIDQKFKLNKSGKVDDKLRELVKTTRKRAIRNLRKNFQIRLNYSLQEDILENYNFKINRILENNLYGYIKIIKDNIYENFHFFSYWFGKNWADLEVSLIGQVIESTGTSKKIIELKLHNNINAWFDTYWHFREKKKFEIIAKSFIANLPKDIENDSNELKKFKHSDKLFLFWDEVINRSNERKILGIGKIKDENIEIENKFIQAQATIIQQALERTKLLKNLETREKPEKQYQIKKIGHGWEVIFDYKKKIVKNFVGMKYIAIALKSPNTPFTYAELMQVKEIKENPIKADLIDLYKSKSKLEQRLEDCNELYNDNPPDYALEIKDIEDELKRIDNEILSIKKGAGFEKGSTKEKRADTFTKAIRTAKKNIHKDFPEFYEHIAIYLKPQSGTLTYNGDIEWEIIDNNY